ncbi:hypothetical protein GP486_002608 [Trichoglossum hirsutum]|uniref:Uncharacterized protein n=1 Tax=Trichoglossum hirsutum TaxID=265104 RepID=A0A9P8LEF8_9PEZI|nr:hypothetical protein GP486_002608 [Trichoglossum hirsutum]
MRFGRNLHRFQVPEWAPFYLDYNGSKRLFKNASKRAVEQAVDADFTELFATLSRDIDSVETFYRDKYAVIRQKATTLYNYYRIYPDSFDDMDLDEVDQYELEDLLGAFTELRDGMRKLQWYGKVNSDGFRKILSKLDKFRSGSERYPYEDEPKLSNSQFASQTKCLKDLERIMKSVAHLSRACSQDQPSSTRISLFLENFCNRSYPSLTWPSAVYRIIREDDASALHQILQEQAPSDGALNASFQALTIALLRCSISCGSRMCVGELLLRVGPPQNDNFAGGDNYLHRLVIKIGQKKTLKGRQGQELHPQGSAGPTKSSEEYLALLAYTLDRLGYCQRHALEQKDLFGRLPLHYAAQYGLAEACQEILKHMQDWGLLRSSTAIDDTLLQDFEGYSPLRLGVIGGHTTVTRTLLEFHKIKDDTNRTANTQNLDTILWTLLAIALQSGSAEIIQLLVATNIGINCRSKHEESGLYIAARSGREDCVRILIEALSNRKTDIDVSETVYGWTPLFIASVEGYLPIVELLLQAGANPEICDHLGWTAVEHAAFRGHMEVAKRLRASTAGEPAPGAVILGQPSTRTSWQSTEYMTSTSNPPATLRRYSSDESQIFVNLGSLDSNKDVVAVDLSPYLSLDVCASRPELGFSVEICAIGASGLGHAVQLPILEDMTNEPWVFSASDLSEVKLVFNILRAATDTDGENILIGSGIALLESLRQGLGPKRESLIRDFAIPILGKDTLKFLGTVTFNFVIVTPFSYPYTSTLPATTHGSWGEAGPTKVVGHRGLGQNFAAHVQLTKDHVPVVYHDFLLSETGTDAPLHTITLDQFMHISKAQSPRGDLPLMAETRYLERSGDQRPRSRSLSAYDDYRTKDLVERMKHTFGFKGFKANTRGDIVQEPFTTLEELLKILPESIEYPMLFEARDWEMDTYAVELNTFVDAILGKVYSLSGNRAINFSSFSPEICILLSTKQRRYPVLFLNDAGNFPTGDLRASSFQQAVHFAKSWNLSGIDMASEPLVMCPRLVKYARDLGLACSSYGTLNNDPKSAKIQAEAGLDAIIVDSVHLISKTLNGIAS